MKQSTNFVTMTMSLRHTATGETNMCSIQVHFLVNKMAEIVERQNLCAVRSGICILSVSSVCFAQKTAVVAVVAVQVIKESSVGDLCSRDLGKGV